MVNRWKELVLGGALIFLVVLAYWPALGGGFIIDDDSYVTENETLRGIDGLGRIWFDLEASPQYYPLVFSSFWVEYQLWGAAPQGYHVTNVVLHTINALLVWVILASLSVPGAWLAAAVFAVHPVNVESVAWIAERKNVLSALFYLLSAWSFARFSGLFGGGDIKRSRVRFLYWASIVALVLALLSKTATVTLPVVLLIMIWWKKGRVSKTDYLSLTPMFIAGIALSLITIWIETNRGGASGELWNLSWIDRVLVASRAVWFYGAKIVWPVGLSFNYQRWTIDSTAWWQYLYPIALGLTLLILWRQRDRAGRGPLVAALYFIVTLGPTLGFINVYFFRYAYVADHFQYLASIGLIALGAAWFVSWGDGDSRRRSGATSILAVSVLMALSSLSWQRSRIFRDLETLCLDTKAKNPTSWLAINNLGNLYLQRNDLEAATRELERAREIAPSSLETHLNLAITYMNSDRYEEAINSSRQAIELNPANKLGYKQMADSYLRSGRPETAIPWFQQAIDKDPEYAAAIAGLGSALARSGRFEEATRVLSIALDKDPSNLSARTNFAISLVQMGRIQEAIAEFEAALSIDPSNSLLQQNLLLARQEAEQGSGQVE